MITACYCALAFAALVLLTHFGMRARNGSPRSSSPAKLALLYGVRPLWGETDESVRARTSAAARSSFHQPAPRFVWWARQARRLVARTSS